MEYTRKTDELRKLKITTDYTDMAAGSVLIECGRTRVICTCSVTNSVPPFKKGSGQGWLTAEYAMLPGATPTRKERDGLKRDGRGVEISRLIGRSLRAACDLSRLGERTLTIDCDVIQADGGTRTAAITGGFVALCIAVDKLIKVRAIHDSPIISQLAAVSVGLVDDVPTLDLDYSQDSRAQVDMNVVITSDAKGDMRFAEVQGTGEGRAFSSAELNALLALAQAGVKRIMRAQTKALGERASVIAQPPRLIAATRNFGKLRELRALFSADFDVVSMSEAGVDLEIEETGSSFEENALIKARALTQLTGCAAVADDSGLVVDALGGAPGVLSARYAGVHGDDEANNQKLINELAHVPAPRRAKFVCAMALCAPNKAPIVARGECEGEIICAPRGENGFGYDPLFACDALGSITFAEATDAQKARVSHRAIAARKLYEEMKRQNG